MRTFRFAFFAAALAPAVATAQFYTNTNAALPALATRQSMDVRAADLDGDGDLDIVKANEFQANTILHNNGSGIFSLAPSGTLPPAVHDSEDVAVADFNSDGYPDLVFCSEDDVTQGKTNVHEYYLGSAAGTFSAAPFQLPDSEANAVIAADLNDDQKPDLLFGNKGVTTVLINNGDGTFTDESNRVPALPRTTQDLAMADVDLDGDEDLFAGNENGNLLFRNDGTGHFSDATPALLPQGVNMETRKVTFGDVNGDQYPDVFLSNVAFLAGKDPQNRLYLNDGTGKFNDSTATHLPADNDHSIDAIFEDTDLDGDLDLVIGNVFGAPLRVYANDSKGHFSDATAAVLGQDYYLDALGLIGADLNGDGLRDLYVCHRKTPQNAAKDLILLRNTPVSLAEPAGGGASLQIYPNPATDVFFLKTTLPHIDSVRLVDVRGQAGPVLPVARVAEGVFRCALPRCLPGGGALVVEVFGGGRVLRQMVFGR